jgi:ESX secretion system protein EccC
VPPAYLGAHATSATLGRGLAESVAAELARRAAERARPGTEPVAGRRIVVLADDLDMIGSGDRDLLRPLLPFLPSARDLGLHLVLSRPVAGAARALYDPVLQAVRETGGSVLLMSGERGEGQLLPRTYAEPLPPGRGRFLRRGEPPYLVQIAQD